MQKASCILQSFRAAGIGLIANAAVGLLAPTSVPAHLANQPYLLNGKTTVAGMTLAFDVKIGREGITVPTQQCN
jgi:alpha-glucuronidase